jgi:hypothetical protein
MNHLGFGHVLMNEAVHDRTTTDEQREEHAREVNGSFAATGSFPAVSRKTFARRERFRPGWMLTLVRQLVELEKRRRDYCSDPRDPADGR